MMVLDIMRTRHGKAKRKYHYDATIQVMIPQNIRHIKGQFDLVIVDEAQHNVLAEDGNFTKIIEQVQPKFQLFLTGTPSKFIRENDRTIAANNENGTNDELPFHINCLGMDMIGFDRFHDVRFDLIKSAYGFTNADYNSTHDIAVDTEFQFKETERTVNNVIYGAVRNIALRNGVDLPKNSDFALEGRKLIKSGNFGKTLIMCRNIAQANQISTIISKIFQVEIMVSESKNDTDSKNLEKFKNNEFNFLCVVNRAREGYDDKKIVNLIDITLTHNIDLIYQMFCRVVRLDESFPDAKLYIKVTSNADSMPEYTMNIMTAALMLGATENLAVFNGSNFRGIVMPRVEMGEVGEDDSDNDFEIDVPIEVDTIDEGGNRIGQRDISDIMAMDLIKMFVEDKQNLVSGNERYAMVTLGESLSILNNPYDVDYIDECVELGIKYCIKNSGKWIQDFRKIEGEENIKLPSKPWRAFNLEGGSVAFSKLLGYVDQSSFDVTTIKECIELAKKYDITSANQWGESYGEIMEKEDVKLPSTPWLIFNLKGSAPAFSKLLGGGHLFDVTTIKECVELGKKHNIKTAGQWGKNGGYKEITEKENVKLPSSPWRVFNLEGGSAKFSKLLGGECSFAVDSIEECLELAKKYDITSASQWGKGGYKTIMKKEGVKLPHAPWDKFNLSGGETEFSKLLGSRKFSFDIDSIEECFELAKKYGVKNSSQWVKKYKEISNKEGVKLPIAPWTKFNLEGGSAAFSKLLGYNSSFSINSIKECVELGKKHNIKTAGQWSNGGYKEIANKENVKLPSTPWGIFNLESASAFTKLLNKKRTPNPKHVSEISRINKKGKTTSSKKMNKFFKDNPSEFFNYHKLRKENMEYWEEAPYEEIAKKITEPTDKVIDFGCGGNDLKRELPNNEVTPVDHVAIDDSVIACDMSDISGYVEDESHDVAVFSLALWGTEENKQDYLSEAFRVLKRKGILYIGDTTGEIEESEDKKQKLIDLITSVGFKIVDDIEIREKFMYITGIKM